MSIGRQILAWAQSVRTRSGEIAYLLSAIGLMFLPMARLSHKGLAPLFAILVLAIVGLMIARGRTAVRVTPLGWVFIAFATWILASALWSITPGTTLKTAISVTGSLVGAYLLFYIAARLTIDERATVAKWLAYGGALGICYICLDMLPQIVREQVVGLDVAQQGDAINYWNSHKPELTVATLFMWPWMAAAWRRLPRLIVVALVVLFSITLAFSHADAARLGFLLGIAVIGGGALLPRIFPIVFGTAIIATIAVLPVLVPLLTSPASPDAVYAGFSDSAVHRILIWQNTAARIAECPVMGFGFDTARSVYRDAGAQLITMLPSTERSYTILTEPIPLHPHNAILQIWLEAGAVGAILFAAFAALAVFRISQIGSQLNRLAAYAVFTNGLLIANVAVGAWQAWWLAAMILIGTLTISVLTEPLDK